MLTDDNRELISQFEETYSINLENWIVSFHQNGMSLEEIRAVLISNGIVIDCGDVINNYLDRTLNAMQKRFDELTAYKNKVCLEKSKMKPNLRMINDANT